MGYLKNSSGAIQPIAGSKQMSSGSSKNIANEQFTYKSYIIYKQDLALNKP